MKNYIIEQLQEAGYKNEGDNRTRAINNLNLLIDAGVISFEFIKADDYNAKENGRSFWFEAVSGKRRCTAYKVSLFGQKYNGHFIPKKMNQRGPFGLEYTTICDNTSLYIDDVMLRVARLISLKKDGWDFMKEEIQAKNGACSCSKCSGRGIIPQFAHYAEGVCFDCGGMGINRSVLKMYIQNAVKEGINN